MTPSPQQPIEKKPRPPVVAIMGHIDHGKSTLLDYIRKSNIVSGEAGGITQHLSAYEVNHLTPAGVEKKITFLDTPGHQAFSLMRERGAAVADIVILIVSAEEGVKTQTKEAYQSILAAAKPFIVAINKIDRPNANVERVKQELADTGIYLEGYGGDVPVASISAKIGTGVSDLLDLLLLVAELEGLSGNDQAPAFGHVIEANRDPQIGVTATLVIKDGTIRTGQFIVAGGVMAKIKKIENFLGQTVTNATFSSPVRVFGFSTIPPVGETFISSDDKKLAEGKAASGSSPLPTKAVASSDSEALDLPLVIKTDVFGTLEAISKEVQGLATEKIRPRIIHSGVGAINENDIKLAASSDQSIILGFNVKIEKGASETATRVNLPIQTFTIIYKLSEWLAEEIARRTPREQVEEISGRAKILKTFSRAKDKQVVGGQVLEGKIVRGKEVRIIRHEAEVARGKITDLQEQKVKVGQVAEGAQFGAEINSKLEISGGDIIEVLEQIAK